MKRLTLAAVGLALVVGVTLACSSESEEKSYQEAGKEWLARWVTIAGVTTAQEAYDTGQWDEMMNQLYALDMSTPLSELPAEAVEAIGEGMEAGGYRGLAPLKLENLFVALWLYHDARVLADPIEEEMLERFGESPEYAWDCDFYGSYDYEKACNLLTWAERNLTNAYIEWEMSIQGLLPVRE
jgi:hypothetical protein